MTVSPAELERAEILVPRRLRDIAAMAILEGGVDLHTFLRLVEDAYRDASWELMQAADEEKETKRQARAVKRVAAAEQDFKLRRARHFREFKAIVELLMERARRSAAKRAKRDEARYGRGNGRAMEDLVADSFRNRMVTKMWHWRHEWRLDDVARWLGELGFGDNDVSGGNDVFEILRQYRRRHRCRVIDVSDA